MKRIIAAVLLAVFAATSFAATSLPNDQYRNTAGEPDHRTPLGG